MADGKQSWPAWYYGPDGQHEMFQTEDQVPDGWHDHPSKVGGGKAKTPSEEEAQRNQETLLRAKYEGKKDADLVAELKRRDVEFGTRWPREKLIATLVADDKKKAA